MRSATRSSCARTLGQPTTRIRAAVRRHGEVTLDPFAFAGPVAVEIEQTVLPHGGWSRADAARHVRTDRARDGHAIGELQETSIIWKTESEIWKL